MATFNAGESLTSIRNKINNTSNLVDSVAAQTTALTNSGQITGIVVLTQAAYDALPVTKLTDGKIYMISET